MHALVAVAALLAGALPPPPTQVVLTGHGTFGEIHFDHAAHLARRISCKSCHGPGPVHKPELTPALAHSTCRACHVELKRGPTSCRDCHVNVREPGGTMLDASAATSTAKAIAAATGPDAAAATSTAKAITAATGADAAVHPERSSGAGAPERSRGADSAARREEGRGAPSSAPSTTTTTSRSTSTSTTSVVPRAPLATDRSEPAGEVRRMIRAGVAIIGGGARAATGLDVVVGLEQGPWTAGVEVAATTHAGAQRTLALLETGVAVPLGGAVRARAAGLCGVDAGEPAYALPAVGARLGLELRRRGTGPGLVPRADASLAFLSALGPRADAAGRAGPERALVFGLLLGWELPP